MAGIFAVFQKKKLDDLKINKLHECADLLKHRGPDNTFILDDFPFIIIIHLKKNQAYDIQKYDTINKNETIAFIDGSIYNLNEFNKKNHCYNEEGLNLYDLNFEGLLEEYSKIKYNIFNRLVGSYSGILIDNFELFGFKDQVGAKPLYYCDSQDFFIFSSELKALSPLNLDVKAVPPGWIISSMGSALQYYKYHNFEERNNFSRLYREKLILKLNTLVKLSVADNIREGERVGCLLSGGLDSTIITHIAMKLIKNLHVYSIGVKGSKDLIFAKQFTKRNNLNHTIVNITLRELIDCLPEVIYSLETYDAALIRSATPMFLLSKQVKAENKVDILLTGEGGDELFGGYDYLDTIHNKQLLNQEFLELLKIEHLTGLQRVDRIPYFFSIEARAPLFDRRIVEFAFQVPTNFKVLKKEGVGVAKKWILRKAFEPELPTQFTWRRKQKFSDGAGSQFSLRDHINNIISDNEFNSNNKQQTNKQITPQIIVRSKEELYYWRIFRAKFNPTEGTLSGLGLTSNYEI